MIELHNWYGIVGVNASASIACALRWGVASVGSFSIRRGSPYMGLHFRCRADIDGRLSLGAKIVKKAGLWLCNLFVKVLDK